MFMFTDKLALDAKKCNLKLCNTASNVNQKLLGSFEYRIVETINNF